MSVSYPIRTVTCGEINRDFVGKEIVLNGWVHKRRDLGGLIFIDVRDRYGITQVVFDPKHDPSLFSMAENLKSEYVIALKGVVRPRPQGSENTSLITGEVEVEARELQVLNTSLTPPFVVGDRLNVDESLRMKFRYIDLRRPKMLSNIKLRHELTRGTREFLSDKGFLEVETPYMIKSTPEGARDYLVPSRIQKGKFYALAQSPQLFKQILMISGIDKYFQIARCFRDEDLRADRQPEFSQVDIEMSFTDQEGVFSLIDELMSTLLKKVKGVELELPIPRITWREALAKYGSDKPDIRFGMEITDITDLVKDSTFGVFNTVIAEGGRIRGVNLKGCAGFSRKQVDELSLFVQPYGMKGVLPIALKGEDFKSPLDKHLSQEQKESVKKAFNASAGDLIVLLAGDGMTISKVLGSLRLKIAKDLKLIPENIYKFLWVLDFPMFAYNEEEQRIEAEHHPFTSPMVEDMHLLKTDPLKMRANAYDLVLNGSEIASGSIRIHTPELQKQILEVIGISLEEAEARFGFLLKAFDYGAPPHGGVALGFDRIVAILAGEESIREVIAFPKNTTGTCLLTGAPVTVDNNQLEILGIEVKEEKPDTNK